MPGLILTPELIFDITDILINAQIWIDLYTDNISRGGKETGQSVLWTPT